MSAAARTRMFDRLITDAANRQRIIQSAVEWAAHEMKQLHGSDYRICIDHDEELIIVRPITRRRKAGAA